MLYIIGLGLADERDITVKGLDAVRRCSKVYLESYTSILGVDKRKLEEFYECDVIIADREMVESSAEVILDDAIEGDVAFLVVGDPFAYVHFSFLCCFTDCRSATTHTDLLLRAAGEKNIQVKSIHNASVMNAIGACGLQLYQFGQTVSIPFFTKIWRPDSFYSKIQVNTNAGFHTLCLLDIKVKEQSEENMLLGRPIFEPPRFMTVNQALEQLLEVERKYGQKICTEETQCIGVARLGADDQMIIHGTVSSLMQVDFGAPLHCLVIVGKTHVMEDEFLQRLSISGK